MASKIEAKSGPWDSEALLCGLRNADFSNSNNDLNYYKPIIWNDLCSEYDSLFFRNELARMPFAVSSDLEAIIPSWRADEDNHYRGLRRIFPLMYGGSSEDIDSELSRRVPDFTPLAAFMTSELRLCLLLAFDEVVTLRSYVDDYQFYDAFGAPALSNWIRRVVRDESLHFSNFVTLIGKCHAHDAEIEAEAIVHEILSHDLRAGTYGATFVLDHTGPQFTAGFLEVCAKTLLRAVRYRIKCGDVRARHVRRNS